jgi:hypothetical protein
MEIRSVNFIPLQTYSLSLKTVPDKPSGWSVIAYNALLDRVLGLGFPREFL